MRNCEYCGFVNEDEAMTCAGCRRKFLLTAAQVREFEPRPFELKKHIRMLFGIYPEGFIPRCPVSLILSIIAPFAGFVVGVISTKTAFSDGSAESNIGGMIQFLGTLFLASLAASAFAVISLWRGEKCRRLTLVWFVLSCWPVYLVFLGFLRRL